MSVDGLTDLVSCALRSAVHSEPGQRDAADHDAVSQLHDVHPEPRYRAADVLSHRLGKTLAYIVRYYEY